MLYYYFGNSDFLVLEQVKIWEKRFLEKFGDFNLLKIKNLDEIDNNFLISNLTSISFLQEKKLIIINIQDNEEKNNFLLNLLDKIPEDNIVLFYQINPDKRSKFYKEIIKSSESKEFSSNSEIELINILEKKYSGKIDRQAINEIIKYKSSNLAKCISEIEKLLITKDFIKKEDVTKNIFPELEESIFELIDKILNLNILDAINIMNIILTQTNIYAFYNNLLANLRTNIYISKLKNKSLNSKEISTLLDLGNKAFLVNKTYKISSQKLEEFYIGLINLDKQLKTGNMIGTEDDILNLEIERLILNIN